MRTNLWRGRVRLDNKLSFILHEMQLFLRHLFFSRVELRQVNLMLRQGQTGRRARAYLGGRWPCARWSWPEGNTSEGKHIVDLKTMRNNTVIRTLGCYVLSCTKLPPSNQKSCVRPWGRVWARPPLESYLYRWLRPQTPLETKARRLASLCIRLRV